MKSKNETMEALEGENQGVITLDDILGKEDTAATESTKNVTAVPLETESETNSPAGMKEITVTSVEVKPIQMIENPLPVPKKKEHRQMDYMLTDLPDDDDFDLKDMTGIDFFDIE